MAKSWNNFIITLFL